MKKRKTYTWSKIMRYASLFQLIVLILCSLVSESRPRVPSRSLHPYFLPSMHLSMHPANYPSTYANHQCHSIQYDWSLYRLLPLRGTQAYPFTWLTFPLLTVITFRWDLTYALVNVLINVYTFAIIFTWRCCTWTILVLLWTKYHWIYTMNTMANNLYLFQCWPLCSLFDSSFSLHVVGNSKLVFLLV